VTGPPDTAAASVASAAPHADLGLPVPPGTRLRLLKRVVARLSRLFLHHQVAYNHAMIGVVADLRTMTELQAQAVRAAELRIGNDIGGLRSDLHRVHQAAVDAQAQSAVVAEALCQADHRASGLDRLVIALGDLTEELRSRIDALTRTERTKHALVDLFLREVRREHPATPDEQRLVALPTGADELYEAIEDAFRGSVETIMELQRPYLRDIEPAVTMGRVVDVGSGRGEWLEVLAQAEVDAYGVDANAIAVARCRQRGLEVLHADALEHLATLDDNALAVISAFHLVEHLSFDDLVQLLDQAIRVLRPGGILLLETPNPSNILVGSGSFYLDPTHVKPLPPDLLEFLVASRGFEEIEVRHLHPARDALEPADHSEAARKTIEPVLERLNTLLFGPLDYAVLGRRPSG
jgi:SAM-dependent methyltransferase